MVENSRRNETGHWTSKTKSTPGPVRALGLTANLLTCVLLRVAFDALNPRICCRRTDAAQ
jgi:hypothetical protein